ncbi:DNA polymerase IV 1 [Striga asiatica]|uniref:DNA polymerase IV 1 n=1 Tax=Striga asiatica TaxID=4170 RepID=A0A5A7NZF9_STRAF|nr:DNA polymerase IV 1 [Striga asiatica]
MNRNTKYVLVGPPDHARGPLPRFEILARTCDDSIRPRLHSEDIRLNVAAGVGAPMGLQTYSVVHRWVYKNRSISIIAQITSEKTREKEGERIMDGNPDTIDTIAPSIPSHISSSPSNHPSSLKLLTNGTHTFKTLTRPAARRITLPYPTASNTLYTTRKIRARKPGPSPRASTAFRILSDESIHTETNSAMRPIFCETPHIHSRSERHRVIPSSEDSASWRSNDERVPERPVRASDKMSGSEESVNSLLASMYSTCSWAETRGP